MVTLFAINELPDEAFQSNVEFVAMRVQQDFDCYPNPRPIYLWSVIVPRFLGCAHVLKQTLGFSADFVHHLVYLRWRNSCASHHSIGRECRLDSFHPRARLRSSIPFSFCDPDTCTSTADYGFQIRCDDSNQSRPSPRFAFAAVLSMVPRLTDDTLNSFCASVACLMSCFRQPELT